MFEHVPAYPGDPILSVVEQFKQDPRPDKINLSIGLYYDEKGAVPVLPSVQQSIQFLSTPPLKPILYLPMGGHAPFIQATQQLLVGKQHPHLNRTRMATIQTVGSSSALKIGADFLKKYFPTSEVWIGNPTWENHLAIFQQAGFTTHQYRYFDEVTKGVDFSHIVETLQQLKPHSIVLLQGCCHNPTGADLSMPQWDQLLAILAERQLIPFIDLAYQGLGDGFDADSYAIHQAMALNLPLFISHSCSKIFSLYGERCGSLTVFCDDAQQAERVHGQLQATARVNYSTPPCHGAFIVAHILNDVQLKALWLAEVEAMRQRIINIRQQLFERVTQSIDPARVTYLLTQKGMFSYTGFTPQQVTLLRERGIYLINSGRLCLTGINSHNIERVAAAMVDILNRTE